MTARHPRWSDRRGAAFVGRTAVAFGVICALGLTTVATAFSVAPSFGHYVEVIPCCGGAALQGSRAEILYPIPGQTDAIPNPGTFLASVGADENGGGDGIQDGVARDVNSIVDQNVHCENGPYYEAETVADSSPPTCFNLGSATGVAHKFSVQKQSSGSWQVFNDGVPPGGKVITHTFTGNDCYDGSLIPMYRNGNACRIFAGGETTAVGAYDVQAEFAVHTLDWQIYNVSTSWFDVTSPQLSFDSGWAHPGVFPADWFVHRT